MSELLFHWTCSNLYLPLLPGTSHGVVAELQRTTGGSFVCRSFRLPRCPFLHIASHPALPKVIPQLLLPTPIFLLTFFIMLLLFIYLKHTNLHRPQQLVPRLPQ